jgi:hypothetical protein
MNSQELGFRPAFSRSPRVFIAAPPSRFRPTYFGGEGEKVEREPRPVVALANDQSVVTRYGADSGELDQLVEMIEVWLKLPNCCVVESRGEA